MHGFRGYVALLLLLALVCLALAVASYGGCGGGTPPVSGTTTTYTNDEYGFTLTHDNQFSEGERVAGGAGVGSSVLDVIFADKNGTVVGDRYVDAIQLSVYELARSINPDEVPRLKAELQGVVKRLMRATASATIVEPLRKTAVNGVPGFSFKYTYTEGGTPLTAVTSFLFKGRYEYQITAQATSKDWDALRGKLETAVQTFTAK